jgi:hypothetical protein
MCQQIKAGKEAQQEEKYLQGLKNWGNKPVARMISGASNRFQAPESAAHIEEVPDIGTADPPPPPPLGEDGGKSMVIPVVDFQHREAITVFDSECLLPFSLIHLEFTRSLNTADSVKIMEEMSRDWAVCTSVLDLDLKDHICYAKLQGWPLNKADTRAWIQEEVELWGCNEEQVARSLGCHSLDDAGPHDYYRYHTGQTIEQAESTSPGSRNSPLQLPSTISLPTMGGYSRSSTSGPWTSTWEEVVTDTCLRSTGRQRTMRVCLYSRKPSSTGS